jgi:hypothetical protein
VGLRAASPVTCAMPVVRTPQRKQEAAACCAGSSKARAGGSPCISSLAFKPTASSSSPILPPAQTCHTVGVGAGNVIVPVTDLALLGHALAPACPHLRHVRAPPQCNISNGTHGPGRARQGTDCERCGGAQQAARSAGRQCTASGAGRQAGAGKYANLLRPPSRTP